MSGVAFSPGGDVLVAAGHRTVFAWRVGDGARIESVGNWGSGHKTIAFSPDGQRLAAGGTEWTIRVGTLTGDPATLTGHRSEYLGLAFHPDGRRLASGSKAYPVRIWNVEMGTEVKTFEGHSGAVYSVAFSPDGKLLASGSEDKTVRLWPLS
jgi:WD40 repeat protein